MKRIILTIIASAAMLCGNMHAQELNNFNRGGRQQVVSPEIKGDSVTFRINAPQAQQVSLQGNWGGRGQRMNKQANGVWETTIDKPQPEI